MKIPFYQTPDMMLPQELEKARGIKSDIQKSCKIRFPDCYGFSDNNIADVYFDKNGVSYMRLGVFYIELNEKAAKYVRHYIDEVGVEYVNNIKELTSSANTGIRINKQIIPKSDSDFDTSSEAEHEETQIPEARKPVYKEVTKKGLFFDEKSGYRKEQEKTVIVIDES